MNETMKQEMENAEYEAQEMRHLAWQLAETELQTETERQAGQETRLAADAVIMQCVSTYNALRP